MTDTYLALLIGNLIMTFPGIIYSVWVETRFVNRTPAILYGLASIGSGLLLISDFGATEMGFWALGIFWFLGAVYLIACWKLDIWGEKNISLPFSHKMIGGFQIAFFYQLFLFPIFGSLPQLHIQLSTAQNVVVWGLILTGILYLGSAIAKKIKND